jgi:outer membrane lipoprotein-sorting protein
MRQRNRAVCVALVFGLTALMPGARAETAATASQPRKPAAPRTVAAQNIPVPPAPIAGQTAAMTKSAGSDANQRALLDRVNAYLSGMQTLVGDFVQVGPDRSRTEGRFYLQKPGRMRFEYNPPSPLELIADGQSVVVRDRKLATQDLYPLSQTPLRFLLAERIDLARDTNLIGVRSDDTFVTVEIEERQTLGGSHRLVLMFGAKDFQLKQWTVTDPQGYDTTVALYNIDTTKKPDPAMFKINYERILQ